MKIVAEDLGKKFSKQWIFKGLNLSIDSNNPTAIIGSNGSGKSTLLQILFGFQTFSKGSLKWYLLDEPIAEDRLHGKIAMAAPYLDLPESFTLAEMIHFHFQFIPALSTISVDRLLEQAQLKGHEEKYIKQFSSGMKQRLKLLLAFGSKTPLLLLDEPCSNLDEAGMQWYAQLIDDFFKGQAHFPRTLVVASNQKFEYAACSQQIYMPDYRP